MTKLMYEPIIFTWQTFLLEKKTLEFRSGVRLEYRTQEVKDASSLSKSLFTFFRLYKKLLDKSLFQKC